MSTDEATIRIIRKRQVREVTGLGLSTISAKVANGTFPPPIKLSDKCVGWLFSEVQDWLAARVAASRRAGESK